MASLIHSTQSEFGALPPGVEQRMRGQLRQMRFGQPQEYARMEHVEVRKFLSSKSVHNWLSEWNLSRTFGTLDSNNNNGRRRERADFCVQCTGEQIDAETGLPTASCAFPCPSSFPSEFPFPPPSALLRQQNALIDYRNANNHQYRTPPSFGHYRTSSPSSAWHFQPIDLSRPFGAAPPSMDASTNTQTTEATGTSGARMNVFRRASWLEEYAQEQLRKMEEAEEAAGKRRVTSREEDEEEADEDEEGRRGGRRTRKSRWRTCCCWCGGSGRSNRKEKGSLEREGALRHPSHHRRSSSLITGTTANSSSTKSSALSSRSAVEGNQQRAAIVKRCTLTAATTTEPKKIRPTNNNWGGRGNYDNVPEEWPNDNCEDYCWYGRR